MPVHRLNRPLTDAGHHFGRVERPAGRRVRATGARSPAGHGNRLARVLGARGDGAVLGMSDFWTYVLGAAAIILLPGPNSIFVLSVAARRGVRTGYRAAA